MLSKMILTPSTVPCKKYANVYPNFAPVIYGLSQNSSKSGAYTQVRVNGTNFSLGSTIGYSVINFGAYMNLPVTYYGSNSISFIVPISVSPGVYNIQVVNSNYPNSLYSNIVTYTIT